MQENKVRVVFEAVLDNFQKNVKSAAKATLEIGDAGEKASKKAGKGVDELDDKLDKLSKTLKSLALGYMGKKLFNIGKENLAFFSDFQDEMKAVHTLLPYLTEEGLNEMSKQAKQFAKDMKVLPEHVTPALYDAISAGVPEVEAFDFLEDAQKSARAGRTDLATSVDFLTNVINSYGREVITATEASDAMFIGMRNGKISFDEMAAHMYSIVPDAAELGIEFNNIAAAAGRMGAMGTPIAQATTQLGAFVRELSNTESKAGDIFYQATNKTLRQFIAEGNNIQDVIMVMDAAAKQLNVEVSTLFGSKEASKVVTSLAKVKDTFANDLHEIQNSSGATEEAYKKMNSTLSAVFDSIRAKIAVFKLDVAEKYLPEIQDAAIKVDESFDRLEQNGSLGRLAESIGGIVATVILEFDKILNNIDSIIDKINSLAYFIENNLSTSIGIVKGLAGAFLFFKTAAAVSHVIKSVAGAIELLTGAQWALNAAQKANPIGFIITLLGLLIVTIIKLSSKYENFTDFILASFEWIKIAFLEFFKLMVWGYKKTMELIEKLIGWIPGIGWALRETIKLSEVALDGLNSKIDESLAKIAELNNKEISVGISASTGYIGTYHEPNRGLLSLDGADYYEPSPKSRNSDISPNFNTDDIIDVESVGGSSKTSKTIHDRIRDIDEKHRPDVDLYESRARLSETKDDTKATKENKNLVVTALRKQADDLLKLQKSSKGQDVKIVEAARNKILTKIEETLNDINDSVNKIVGDFNIPSELRVLTEYQYKVEKADNKLTKRLVYSPNIDMYLTIGDTGERGIAQVRQEMESFTNAIFDDKNDLVTRFMQDVTRN